MSSMRRTNGIFDEKKMKRRKKKFKQESLRKCKLCLNSLSSCCPHIMQTPGPGHKANYTDEVIRNTNAFLEAPVKTERCPTDIVYEALAPRANFRAGFGALLLLQLLSFNVARRSAFCRESAFSENVLAPEDEEFKKDVPKPAASAPEIPLDQAAVFFHKPFRDNALCCQIADVLEELIDHVGDDLKVG